MKLRNLRLKNEWSVSELSKRSGVPIRTIENIEKNDDCKVSTARLLAEALDCYIDDLIGGDYVKVFISVDGDKIVSTKAVERVYIDNIGDSITGNYVIIMETTKETFVSGVYSNEQDAKFKLEKIKEFLTTNAQSEMLLP